jgi:hypothetical protein
VSNVYVETTTTNIDTTEIDAAVLRAQSLLTLTAVRGGYQRLYRMTDTDFCKRKQLYLYIYFLQLWDSADDADNYTSTPEMLMVLSAMEKLFHDIGHCDGELEYTVAVNVVTNDEPVENTGRFRAYWGWKTTDDILTESEIEASIYTSAFTNNGIVTADYRTNNSPRYLWVAIPLTQPARTDWYVSDLNNGQFGTGELFDTGVTVGNYRFYITSYPTQQNELPIQFRI